MTRALLKSRTGSATLRMAYLAHRDPLTHLPNRVLLNERIAQAIAQARRNQHQLAVLYVDVDHFKQINESHGHSIGDKLLSSVGGRMAASLRTSDTVGRQASDEFVVLLPNVARFEDAALAAQRILTFLRLSHRIGRLNLHITASIGISLCPDDGADPEALTACAAAAACDAKQHGRNTYRFFRERLNERALERRSLESQFRRALEQDEFALRYQPIVDLKNNALMSAEALLRWCRADRIPALPAQFLAAAEKCGYIIPIGRWVLREACRQARSWIDAGLPPVSVSVNVSPAELQSRGFALSVRDTLLETGLDPRYLKLELTEAAYVDQCCSGAGVLHLLRDLDVAISLDHVGTERSCLAYLRRFPVDALKLDGSLVRGLCLDPGDTRVVDALIGIGESFQLRTIAQDIENREQLLALQNRRCAGGQGFYFKEPAESAEFAKLLDVECSAGVRA
jgi:diguanylate cyclase